MAQMTVTTQTSTRPSRSFDARIVLAFFAIYVLWGTTFLAIRIAVQELPPLFAAGVRFFIAGIVLYGFLSFRVKTQPTGVQWRNLAILGLLMFVAEYGPLFWAEKYVSSGVASLLAATLPLITMVLEVFILREQRFRLRFVVSTVVGFLGVGVLLVKNGGQHIPILPCIAILAGATTWSLGSVLTCSLDLPESKPLTAGAAMALGGGMLLVLSALFGEMRPMPHVSIRGALALLYLIFFGSLLAFTAYVWLLGRMPATRVASHAYVNPVVAVALGYFFAGEVITMRTLLGAALIIASVFLILREDKEAAT